MARVQFVETITLPLGPGGSLVPVPGFGTTPISINPADETETTQAPAYAGRTGATLASSLASDSSGTVSYWLEAGDYNIHFSDQQSPARIADYIRGFNAAIIDTNSLIVGAQDLIQFTGDYKHSEQPSDHGLKPDGSFEWLLITGGTDGTGRLVDHIIYNGLWSLFGSPTPNGLGQFKLPNSSGRSLIAAGASTGLTSRTAGQNGGTETVLLTSAQSGMPNHGHILNWSDPGHHHSYGFDLNVFCPAGTPNFTFEGLGSSHNVNDATTGISASVANSGVADASAAHSNMQPWVAKNLFIKT